MTTRNLVERCELEAHRGQNAHHLGLVRDSEEYCVIVMVNDIDMY